MTYRLKRAGHVTSKMRFQSAQLDAYLTDGLWLRLAATANQAMSRLVTGLAERGLEPDHMPQTNMVFLRADPAEIDAWAHAGLDFYRLTKDRARFVTSFRSTPEQIDEALRRIDGTTPPGVTSPDSTAAVLRQAGRTRSRGQLARRRRSG